MKKFITITLIIISSSMLASAQLNIGGTLGGVPIGYSSNGSINIGKGASSIGMGGGGPLIQLLSLAQTIVSRLVPLMVGLGVLAFFWYLIQYIWKGTEDPAKRTEGLKGMGYSLLAIFVMVSIWGIISLMSSVLGVGVGGGLPPLQMPAMK